MSKSQTEPEAIPDEEAERFQQNLKTLAQQWHTRLQDPVVKKMVDSGEMTISPLISELLNVFPQQPKPSTGD